MDTVVKNVIQSFADKFPHLQEHISSLMLHISNKRQDKDYVIYCIKELEYFFKVGKLTVIDDLINEQNNFMDFETQTMEVAIFMKELSNEEMDKLIIWFHEIREDGAKAKSTWPAKDKQRWLLYSGFYNPNLFAFKHLSLFCH